MANDTLKLRLILFICIVVVLLTGDLLVKELAFRSLPGTGPVEVIPGFWSFRYTANDDIGFSLFRTIGVDRLLGKTPKLVFIVAFQFIGVAIATWFFFSPKNYFNSWVKRIPLALIASGGLGNAIDRIIRGFVVDYVHWYNIPLIGSWPIFNLADTYTVIGVCFLAVFILFTKSGKEEKKIEPAATNEASGPKSGPQS